MRIQLLTDAPKHNLALMKLASYYKSKGDEVILNMPLIKADIICASWLFENGSREYSDLTGGVGFDPRVRLLEHIEKLKPDYSLFNLDHSLGYTFRACFRKCPFCKVPLQRQDRTHHSIWEFHDPKFEAIELLNNNTFYDPLWEETFKEIHKARLRVIDDNGYDLRLLDDHKAWWLSRLKWDKGSPRFAWDRIRDEPKIRRGLKLLKKHDIRRKTIYVLMGFDSTIEEDLHRLDVIHSYGHDPYPMLFKSTPTLWRLRKLVYSRGYRGYGSIAEAWRNYNRRVPTTEGNGVPHLTVVGTERSQRWV